MIIHPITGKKIHFGSSLHQDYTVHTINGNQPNRIHQYTRRIFYYGEGFNYFKKNNPVALFFLIT
jgi:hypothetical protein